MRNSVEAATRALSDTDQLPSGHGLPRKLGRPAGERDTRGEVLDAAERLFADQGYVATSTREIAELAGVRQSMISYYFQTKQQLFEDTIKRRGL